MFQVKDKKTEELVNVYNIKVNTSGYPTFLVYEGNGWVWKSAKHFKPIENNMRIEIQNASYTCQNSK